MKTFSDRMVIHAKDVALIASVHRRTGARVLNRIRKQFNKPPHSYVTIEEFCAFTKMREDHVRAILR